MTETGSGLDGSAGLGAATATGAGRHSAAAAGAAGSRPGLRRWLKRVLWAAVPVAAFFVYLRVSQTQPTDFYGGIFTQQGWDMLHGNLLLHGWSLADASFYSTELPLYLLVDAAVGLTPDVLHIAAAVTFTLLLLLVALLASQRARGREAAVAVALAAGIVCSPQLGGGIFVLLGAPDHLGTCVPVLLAWLIVDRAPPRWYVPVAVCVLLAWVLVADSVVLLTAVVPLVGVCAFRICQAVVRRRLPWRSRWYEASLIAAGLAAAGISREVLAVIRAHGGFYVHPVGLTITSISSLPQRFVLTIKETFLLFGGDFFGQKPGPGTALLVLHLVGLALAAWAVCIAVRRFAGLDLVSQLLVIAVLINLVGFVLWGGLGTDVSVAREMVAVLPFSAVLAGRLLPGRLLPGRLLTGARLTGARLVTASLSLVLIGYLASLAIVAAHPVTQPQYQQLTSWLARHRLDYGLAKTGLSGDVTVSSNNRIELCPVLVQGGVLTPGQWEADASWFNPRRHVASFLVQYGYPAHPSATTLRKAFGAPKQIYRFGSYTVLIWDQNLLTALH